METTIRGSHENEFGHDLEEDFDNLIYATVFQCRLCRATGIFGEDWLGGILPEILNENCPAKFGRKQLT